jgi:hypothetical protein
VLSGPGFNRRTLSIRANTGQFANSCSDARHTNALQCRTSGLSGSWLRSVNKIGRPFGRNRWRAGQSPQRVISGSADHVDGLSPIRPVYLSKRTHAGPAGWGQPWAITRRNSARKKMELVEPGSYSTKIAIGSFPHKPLRLIDTTALISSRCWVQHGPSEGACGTRAGYLRSSAPFSLKEFRSCDCGI